ncbi:excinuclease ABC, C subunit [Lancefieldella rimae]|uniref:UvrABC system protein C n=2 Tax=Lancefieldella rimae TaxID=1383 RepID=B9CP64_LANR4|nr:excinuclease ABC subunit UvrC [Lancefieldella rimae]EEE16666.1 excinuclease ABC, C subunit [Lancefieldella rimae ATCC 49626]KRO01834.1 excinuclease ABC, C subunit [Lancefieldella rimae]
MARSSRDAELPSHKDFDDLVSIREQVDQVPVSPGCYLWKDGSGKVIYVGKAKNLRSRMRQYVTLQDDRAKIPLMMQVVRSFDYIVVENEHEALVLERNLIAQYRPYFNVDFKDDKSYPFIAITESDVFPAIKYTREKHKKGTRYFGPYTDSYAARQTIDTLRKVVPICTASCTEWKRCRRELEKHPNEAAVANMIFAEKGRPCFDYHVGRGPGVCVGAISTAEYGKHVRQVENFLRGNRSEIVMEVQEQMQEAAADLDFERAARLKGRLDALSALDDRQQVTFPTSVNLDLIGFYREETISAACVFVVREGRTVRSVEFILDKGLDVSEDELVSGFVKRYYDETADVPAEVDVPLELSDAEVISEWLSDKRGHRCGLHLPQRGEKFRLLEMASKNARHALMRHMIRTGYSDDRSNQALLQLESALALEAPPLRIECFDISTLHGSFTVASMVVFTNGKPDKSQYRRFKIHAELDEANDFVSMSEVLGRRYSPERMADKRFGSRPDLLVVDGGKPQLTAAIQQLAELGLDIPVCGLAKSDEEVFVPWDDTPIVLPSGSASLYLIKQVRDESHRFAITFHRELRDKAMTVSILDEIPGVGPKRKKDLMRHFGSFKKLNAASADDIADVKGISPALAQTIFDELKAWRS